MTELLDDPELCEHIREDMRNPLLGLPAWFYFSLGCAECERKAHEAWMADVRARFEEALFHIAHGLPVLPLDQYPCAKYPRCDQILGGGWPELPEGWTYVGTSDLAVMTSDGGWHFGEEAEALMHGS